MNISAKILQLDVLGSFDFFSTIISLDAISGEELRQVLQIVDDLKRAPRACEVDECRTLSRVLPLASHESTHFCDATSTLWGARHLYAMDSAGKAFKSRVELNFHYAKRFYDHVRMIRLPTYYTVVGGQDLEKKWAYDVTIGRTFSHDGSIGEGRPVLFCRFATPLGALLARSPVSTVSILEASAMAQELFARARLQALLPAGVREVERLQYKAEMLGNLYNHRITEYSVCVHLVANYQRCEDAMAAFRLVSLMTRICLNFPRVAFEKIAASNGWAKRLGWVAGAEHVIRMSEALSALDMGALFYLLTLLLPPRSYVSDDAAYSGVEHALQEVGFSIKQLKELSMEEFVGYAEPLAESEYRTIRTVSVAGASNFEAVSWSEVELPFAKLSLPPVLLGDNTQAFVLGCNEAGSNNVLDLDLDACFDEMYRLERQVMSFGDACL